MKPEEMARREVALAIGQAILERIEAQAELVSMRIERDRLIAELTDLRDYERAKEKMRRFSARGTRGAGP